MSIRSRLDELERRAGKGVCPDCGGGGGGSPVLLPIVFDAGGHQVIPPDPGPCPTCGRRPLEMGAITFDGGREARADG